MRIVYAKAGTLPAAEIVRDDRAIIDHKLYWMATTNIAEARYLIAILNSVAVRHRIQDLQSQGQFGPRDFDKVMFSLPIPRFSRGDPLHRELAVAGGHAERIAAGVEISADAFFQTTRRVIRESLNNEGVLGVIDGLVGRLLED